MNASSKLTENPRNLTSLQDEILPCFVYSGDGVVYLGIYQGFYFGMTSRHGRVRVDNSNVVYYSQSEYIFVQGMVKEPLEITTEQSMPRYTKRRK